MSVNVRPVKRFVEEQKKKNPEIKLSEKATQLLTDMPKMDSPEVFQQAFVNGFIDF